MDEATKSCSKCGGVILAAARKCKHCRSWLEEPSRGRASLRRVVAIAAVTIIVGGWSVVLAWYAIRTEAPAQVAQAPAPPVPTPPGPPPASKVSRPPDPRQARQLQLQALVDGPVPASVCLRLEREAGVPTMLCQVLAEATRQGRTSHTSRVALREELKDRGYAPLRGYLISRHQEGLYELSVFGTRGVHALLRSRFPHVVPGYFSIWAKRLGTQEVATRDGSRQTWDEYQEDAFGAIVQRLFTVREGDRTRETAREALRALIATSI